MQKMIFKGPVLTSSGYGVHARQLLKAVIETRAYDISVSSLAWGHTPFIHTREPFLEEIRKLIERHDREQSSKPQYDISVQVTIPNEFEKLARLNVGVTAGIEVDRVSAEWIKKANDNVDLVIVPSVHSAQTFAGVKYASQDGKETLQLQKPIVVCPEGFDADIFNVTRTEPTIELEPAFNFLSVGIGGLDKPMGEDRKNITSLVKWFCERFKGERDVGLVLKTSIVNGSLIDFEVCKRRIAEIKRSVGCEEFPRIKLVHGHVSSGDMAALYKHPKVKAYVSLAHGEGFGLPILEAAACGLPVIATNWSGHLDFLKAGDKRLFVPVEFDLKEIPGSAVWQNVMDAGTRWADPREEDAKLKMRKVRLSHDVPTANAIELAASLAKTHTTVSTDAHFVRVLTEFVRTKATPSVESQGRIVETIRQQLGITEKKSLIYTMPMSAGDVFVSTAVVDSLKAKFPEHFVFFATNEKYASLLKNNPDIHRVIKFEEWMTNVPFLEQIFDEVYTPNLSVQMTSSNWVHGGKGRSLSEEFAAQCQVKLGQSKIWLDPLAEGMTIPIEGYVVIHPGSGKGQWEARNYRRWREVVRNIKKLSGKEAFQVGLEEDQLIEGCVDLRGKTTYNQLATIIKNASVVIGIDSVSMHMANSLHVPVVALFGSSYPTSTGPAPREKLTVLLETPDRYGCTKACYKYQCKENKGNPCINEISPFSVVSAALSLLGIENDQQKILSSYEEIKPKIAGYTTVLNAESGGYPYVESIRSMLGFCDEVVVVDGGSTDGTVERIKSIGDPRVKLFKREWDRSEPAMDGMQKAYARAMCSVGPDDFLWQQDADEVVHERDYQKIRKLAAQFVTDVNLVSMPVVELWGSAGQVRTDRHPWKWRMSRNDFRITHGINKSARMIDEKTGKTYARKGMSDGCEYVDIMTGEYVPHVNFYSQQLEQLRQADPTRYGQEMNRIFGEMPSVYHYSWYDIKRKIRNFKKFWNVQWSTLYNDQTPVDRFPGAETDDEILRKAKEVEERGGEHGPAKTFPLQHGHPAVMADWIVTLESKEASDADGYIHDDEATSGPAAKVA